MKTCTSGLYGVISTIISITLLCVLQTWTWACEDFDHQGCISLIAQNPNLCLQDVYANTACPRTCGNCLVTCYHCDVPVTVSEDCNTTKLCQIGEKCMWAEVGPPKDGHHGYRVNCATNEMCEGTSIFVGRRDISTYCCSDDMCNAPVALTTPTTTMATPTTTVSTTTQITICETRSHTLSCLNGLVLFITNVLYGRLLESPATLCNPFRTNVTGANCYSKTTPMNYVTDLCDGKSSCVVHHDWLQLGPDPCSYIPKYLQINYQCVIPTTTSRTASQIMRAVVIKKITTTSTPTMTTSTFDPLHRLLLSDNRTGNAYNYT